MNYTAGETTYAMIAGRGQPRKVTVNGREIFRQDNLEQAPVSWKYLDDKGFLLLKIEHSGKDNVKIHY